MTSKLSYSDSLPSCDRDATATVTLNKTAGTHWRNLRLPNMVNIQVCETKRFLLEKKHFFFTYFLIFPGSKFSVYFLPYELYNEH